MINDPHAILLGLFREAEMTETLFATTNFVKKKLKILDEFYILEEEKLQGKHMWNLFREGDNQAMEREDVLDLYTRANFKRHEKSQGKN